MLPSLSSPLPLLFPLWVCPNGVSMCVCVFCCLASSACLARGRRDVRYMRDFDSAVTRKRERPLLEDVCVYFGEVTIDIRFFGNGNGKKPRDKKPGAHAKPMAKYTCVRKFPLLCSRSTYTTCNVSPIWGEKSKIHVLEIRFLVKVTSQQPTVRGKF